MRLLSRYCTSILLLKVTFGAFHVHRCCWCFAWTSHLSFRFVLLSIMISWIWSCVMVQLAMCWLTLVSVVCSIGDEDLGCVVVETIMCACQRACLIILGGSLYYGLNSTSVIILVWLFWVLNFVHWCYVVPVKKIDAFLCVVFLVIWEGFVKHVIWPLCSKVCLMGNDFGGDLTCILYSLSSRNKVLFVGT